MTSHRAHETAISGATNAVSESTSVQHGGNLPKRITVLHLTASPSYGGPERQMLGLGRELEKECDSIFVSFLEEGRCWDFVQEAEGQGFTAHALRYDTPRVLAALEELEAMLRTHSVDLLVTHSYKARFSVVSRRIGWGFPSWAFRVAARPSHCACGYLTFWTVSLFAGWTESCACRRGSLERCASLEFRHGSYP